VQVAGSGQEAATAGAGDIRWWWAHHLPQRRHDHDRLL